MRFIDRKCLQEAGWNFHDSPASKSRIGLSRRRLSGKLITPLQNKSAVAGGGFIHGPRDQGIQPDGRG